MMTPSNTVAVRRNKEAGQTIILTTFALVVLLGFMGLAIDMGVLRYEKRLQQTAADAAALAAASNLCNSGNCTGYGGVTAGGQNAAGADGFTDSGGGQVSNCGDSAAVGTVCVQINNGPDSGPHSGNLNYVEALVAVVQPTYFMRVLNINKETVTARAVATNLSGNSNNGGCLYTLGPPTSSIEGVNINGNAELDAPTCGINDDGNYNTKGNSLIVKADTFGVSGSKDVSGKGGSVTCGQVGPCPEYGIPAVADPLSTLAPPSEPAASSSCPAHGSCDVTTPATVTTTLYPGTYDSLTIGKNSTAVLEPGIYYIDGSGGLQFNGGGTVTGDGVMFYFTGTATINAVGGGNKLDNVDLTPITSGPYTGMLFYQDPADTSAPTLGGNDGSTFGGISYFPSVELTFYGTATNTAGIVITKAFSLSGTPTVNLAGAASLPPGTDILTVATLVE